MADIICSIIIYFVSFIVSGNFWNQHRRLFDDLKQFGNTVLWLNILFLFFLSLVPLFTKWVIQNPKSVVPAVGNEHELQHEHVRRFRKPRKLMDT
ncbi:MAG: DUF1211 domain-containing protein [Clostridiaceae bacterium]|nr:DUF1211 domain-containing protein [Clostridiaceae bacterium]